MTLARNPESTSAPWWVPSHPNPFFTGRAKILQDLHKALLQHHAVALTEEPALGQHGGIGKTQTAVAYVYRYRKEYTAVLWARADSDLMLKADLSAIATCLGLGGYNGRNMEEAGLEVKGWLETHAGWLLILDNAEDPGVVGAILRPDSTGKVLLISRTSSWITQGVPASIALGPLLPEEAVAFLYKRTGRLKSDPSGRSAAMALAKELGNFPLALEQAGAYMAATQLGFQEYLHGLSAESEKFRETEGCLPCVAAALALGFGGLEKDSPASADLLRVSAFLYPDRIPLELLVKGAPDLGAHLAEVLAPGGGGPDLPLDRFDCLVDPLARLGLFRWDLDRRSISLPPLALEAARAGMDEPTRRLWAERAVRAVHRALPSPDEGNDPCPVVMLQQADTILRVAEEWKFDFPEAGHLAHRLGRWMRASRSDAAAEERLKRALAIYERVLGRFAPEVAGVLNDLAMLDLAQGRHLKAEPLLKQALAVAGRALPPEHPERAVYLTGLARWHHAQTRYLEAEPLYREALAIRKRALPPDHPEVAAALNNVAALYYDQGRFAEAAPLLEQALAIARMSLPRDHPDTVICLLNLAALYHRRKKYARAELLYREALAIREQRASEDPVSLADDLERHARVLRKLGRRREAAPLTTRARSIRLALAKKPGRP